MDGRRARLLGPVLERLPRLERIERTEPTDRTDRTDPKRSRAAGPNRLSDELAPGWAAALGFGWPLAVLISMAITPAPANPEAAPALLESMAQFAFMVGLWTTVITAAHRHVAAAATGALTGLVALGITAACPATGHHELAAWWFVQLGLTVAMLAVSLAALGRRSRATT